MIQAEAAKMAASFHFRIFIYLTSFSVIQQHFTDNDKIVIAAAINAAMDSDSLADAAFIITRLEGPRHTFRPCAGLGFAVLCTSRRNLLPAVRKPPRERDHPDVKRAGNQIRYRLFRFHPAANLLPAARTKRLRQLNQLPQPFICFRPGLGPGRFSLVPRGRTAAARRRPPSYLSAGF